MYNSNIHKKGNVTTRQRFHIAASLRPRTGCKEELPLNQRATIRDVALAAKVSPSTVSRYFNDTGYVSIKTRRRIENAVTRMGYEPNLVARGLKSGRSRLIVLGVPDIGNPYYARMAKTAQPLCEERGYALVLVDFGEKQPRKAEPFALAKRICAAGILLASVDPCSHIDSSGIPMVGMCAYEEPGASDVVTVHESGGINLAVSHLAALGHRDIFYVGGLRDSGVARGRRESFLRQMALEGLPVSENAIIETGFSQEDGYLACLAFMSRPQRPTAICCANDLLAFGVMNALIDLNIPMPEMVSVTGMDDIPFAPISNPRLTTVTNDSALFTREAFSMLADRIEGRYDGPARHVQIPNRLIIRDSTCPPRQGR